jgi:hypothetical protein
MLNGWSCDFVASRRLVIRGAVDVVDDVMIHGALLRDKFQAELLLQGVED